MHTITPNQLYFCTYLQARKLRKQPTHVSTACHQRSILVASAQAQHQVEGRLLLDVVVGERAAVLELLAREDEALLVRGDALLVLQQGGSREAARHRQER